MRERETTLFTDIYAVRGVISIIGGGGIMRERETILFTDIYAVRGVISIIGGE